MAEPRKTHEQMPAKLTVIVYILICFEVGILLMILPWTPYWDDNFFLYFLTGKMHAAWLGELVQSGYTRGAVTALGVINLAAGVWEGYRFRESVRAFSAWEAPPHEPAKAAIPDPANATPPRLPDHRSSSVPPPPGPSVDGN
ncbi:MAG: hypothetical protein ABI882_15610 [Acidobacteriota bacterium]